MSTTGTKPTKGPSKKKRLLVRGFKVLGVLLLVFFAIHTVFYLQDRQYQSFLNNGVGINGFLKEFGKTVRSSANSNQVEPILNFYAEDFASPDHGDWIFDAPTESSGIRYQLLRSAERSGQDGAAAVKQFWTSYVEGVRESTGVVCKINLAEAIQSGKSAVVTVKFILDGSSQSGEIIQDRFFFRWRLRSSGKETDQWEIIAEELLQDPEVENVRVAGNRDGFEAIDLGPTGIDFVHQRDPYLDPDRPGVDLKFAIIQHASGGVSVTDYDNDGWPDIFFADGVRSRLYRNLGGVSESASGSVRFVDQTQAAGLSDIDRAHSSLFVDFDNDGDKDLLVIRYQAPTQLFLNDGQGRFTDRTSDFGLTFSGPGVSATSLDYNLDGFADVYIGVNGNAHESAPRIPFFARNGLKNRLLKNVNGERFEDVTEAAGVGGHGWSLAVCRIDLDQDGWHDIGVANDFGRKSLFRNNGDGTFSEIAKQAGTLDFSGGMGIVSGDLDGDLVPDLYTSNIYSNQRWLGEEKAILFYTRNFIRSKWLFEDLGEFIDLYGLVDGDWRSVGRMAGEGNSLFANNGDGTFTERRDSRTNRAGWGWDVSLFDADNDSDLDIYAANGWITGEEKADL